jgi:hypothetical protein
MSEPTAPESPAAESGASEPTTAARLHEAATPEEPATPVEAAAPGARRGLPVSARNAGLLVLGLAIVGGIIYAFVPGSPNGRVATSANAGSATPGTGSATPGKGATVPATGSTPGGSSPATAPGPMPGAPVGGPKPLHPGSGSGTAVAQWSKGPGGKALLAVTAQSGYVLQAHGVGEYPEMLQYCGRLTSAVHSARATTPIPDTAMQAKYSASLAGFERGAADCQTAIVQHAAGVEDNTTTVNQALLKTAVSELNLGVSDLYIATEALRTQ